jgi:hypothetical protein
MAKNVVASEAGQAEAVVGVRTGKPHIERHILKNKM